MRVDSSFENRRGVILAIILGVALLFVIRLAVLQLFSDEYDQYADSNARLKVTITPERGVLYDRNGKVMAYNSAYYDVMVTIREMKNFDTITFCRCLDITPDYFVKRMKDIRNRKLNPGYSTYTPQVFMTQLTMQQSGPLQESLYRLPGCSIRERSLRSYSRPVAAHALGYVGEVDKKDIERDNYYVAGDMSGRSGVEKMYERQLRGQKGVHYFLRDVHGRVKGSYENGILDQEAIPGKDLTLSLDLDLQEYAEKLMANKRGAIVAIEPSTGEILAYVSSPTYDPALLVGNASSSNYATLQRSEDKVFLNRPIQSFYPPGSTFKPLQGLILLQEQIVTPQTSVGCSQGYVFGSQKMGCHSHPSPLSLVPAISTSCNAWFASGYRSMIDAKKYKTPANALDVWNSHAYSFGYGHKLGVDIAFEASGSLPTTAYYNKVYGKGSWKGATIISNSIGQGEILATPMQIANLCATIANRGWYRIPHLVKGIEGDEIDTAFTNIHYTTVGAEHFPCIVEGMHGAVTNPIGTSKGVAIPGIEVCGKTGTAQNSHGDDHSIFMCFAPMDEPRIAMVVFIENGGFGATWAVPMASLILEKYLKGFIDPSRHPIEERLENANLMQ